MPRRVISSLQQRVNELIYHVHLYRELVKNSILGSRRTLVLAVYVAAEQLDFFWVWVGGRIPKNTSCTSSYEMANFFKPTQIHSIWVGWAESTVVRYKATREASTFFEELMLRNVGIASCRGSKINRHQRVTELIRCHVKGIPLECARCTSTDVFNRSNLFFEKNAILRRGLGSCVEQEHLRL